MPLNSASIRAPQGGSTSALTGKSSFLDLPPELRNRIYDYVLENACTKVVISLLGGTNARWHNQRRKAKWRQIGMDTLPSPLALLVTCKQVYSEAKLMVYHKLPFFVGKIPFIPRDLETQDNKIAATMIYRQALFKQLTDGKIAIGLQNLQTIQRIEFSEAREFLHFLKHKRDTDEYFRATGPANRDIIPKLFKGVKTVVVHTDAFNRKPGYELKFGSKKSHWDAWPPGRLRDHFHSLEEIVVLGPCWSDDFKIDAETR